MNAFQQQHNEFSSRGYSIVRQGISRDVAEVATRSALFHQSYGGYYTPEPQYNSIGRYVDIISESILIQLQPKMEAVCGEKLYPCYSFLRIYGSGAVLPRHIDRPSCEISATLTLGFDAQSLWPFYAGSDDAGTEVLLEPGDFLVYKGAEVPHWRNRFEGNYWVQVFLHYVRVNGPFAEFRFDRRPGIGMPAGSMQVGRNDPCICGSGKKYKHCCGKAA